MAQHGLLPCIFVARGLLVLLLDEEKCFSNLQTCTLCGENGQQKQSFMIVSQLAMNWIEAQAQKWLDMNHHLNNVY